MEVSRAVYEHCTLCPRCCRVNRCKGERGVCGMSSEVRIARAALHFWEEPPISGESGSGAIFFSGCPLRCVYCQNYEISWCGFGRDISLERLVRIMLTLESQGALNINLVTPSHFAPHVIEAVHQARLEGLSIPIVCNTSGYESVATVEALSEVVDIWLTDFKYASCELSGKLSGASDYPEVAARALHAMVQSVKRSGGRACNSNGSMRSGIIVRHLVLPGHVDDSLHVLHIVKDIAQDVCDLSIMNQYTPNERCRKQGGQLARTVTPGEYECVLDEADDLGFERLWWQEGGTVSESFIPAFDLTGVETDAGVQGDDGAESDGHTSKR